MLGAAALLPALPRLLRFRLAAAAAVLVVLVAALAGTTWGAIRHVTSRGFRDFYAVVLPFDGRPHPEMHVLVVLAAALFCVAIAVTADGRPFVAAATVAAGVGWPATILPARNTIAMGALGLFAALWPLVVARSRDRREILPGIGSPDGRRARRRGLRRRRRPPVNRGGRTGRTGTCSVHPAPGKPSRWSGTRATAGSISRRRRRPSSTSRRPDGRSTGARRRWTRFEGDRWSRRSIEKPTRVGSTRCRATTCFLVPRRPSRTGSNSGSRCARLVDDHVIAASQPMKLAAGSDTRVVLPQWRRDAARDGG